MKLRALKSGCRVSSCSMAGNLVTWISMQRKFASASENCYHIFPSFVPPHVMGTRGNALISLDINALVTLLNKALADEWLAYYQYWMGAKVARGIMREAVVAELDEHAADELRHAQMLTERILQLDGTPLLDPKQWYEMSNCGYDPPTDPSVHKLLEQNIKGEQCAIDVYKSLMDFTKDKDEITYQMALEILTDEIEHEDDLQTVQEDLAKIVR